VKEIQREFLAMVEEAITQTDLAVSMQNYQLALGQAKARFNLAVCPSVWLLPARMIINTESIVGYNNKLKQAVVGMKLGIKNDVNLGTKKAALKLMAGGPSKINLPNSHPSNPIHKAAMAAQTGKPLPKKEERAQEEPTAGLEPTAGTSQHEINKTAVIIVGVGLEALILIALR